MITFIPIPGTDLEIASHGRSHNRIIFFRTKTSVEPISAAADVRVILIGNPEAKIRYAMKAGNISRSKLAKLVDPVSGNTYHKLRIHVDQFIQ